MRKLLVWVLVVAIFLATSVAAAIGQSWIVSRYLLGEPSIAAGRVPQHFQVAIETRDPRGATSYRIVSWRVLQEGRSRDASESLRLTRPAWHSDDFSESFTVLSEGPDGQLIEATYDDGWPIWSVYRVQQDRAYPVSMRRDGTLLYLLYLVVGVLAGTLVARAAGRRLAGKG
jgi:hypothetical protein